jgi:hypothetical protein
MQYYSNYKYDTRIDCEFSVCIDGKSVKEYEGRDGNVYIEGRRGSEFTLKFKNNTSSRVLAVISVDGLSVTDGKPAGKHSDGYVCGAWQTIEIPGWKLNSNKVAKFEFQPQGDRKPKTYVEELAAEGFDVDTGNQGVIGVMVFQEVVVIPYTTNVHHYHHQYPTTLCDTTFVPTFNMMSVASGTVETQIANFSSAAVQPQFSSAVQPQNVNFSGVQGLNSSSNEFALASLGTAFGEEENFKTQQIDFKRQEKAVWTGLIFYDTRSNLQKMGIIFDTYLKTPNAFPSMNEGCYIPKSKYTH